MIKKQRKHKKNSPREAHTATKRIGAMILFTLFLVSFTSALDFDDVKYYDSEKREYELKNAFGLGDTIANIKLDTANNQRVPIGYQRVAQITITNGENDYDEIINGMELYNVKDGMKEIIRNVDYQYQTFVDVPSYITTCEERMNANETGIEKYACAKVESGTHKELQWVAFSKNSLIKEEVITIGIFTIVEAGDKVEWIINMYGNEKLTEWATWSASLNVNIMAFWNLNEGSGTTAVDNTGNGNDGELFDDIGWGGSNCVLSDCLNISAGNVNITDAAGYNTSFLQTDSFSVSLWFNATSITSANQQLINKMDSGDNGWSLYLDNHPAFGGDYIGFVLSNTAASNWIQTTNNCTGLDPNQYYHLAMVYNGTSNASQVLIFLNGTECVSTVQANTLTGEPTYEKGVVKIGEKGSGTEEFHGKIDEVGIWNRTLTSIEVVQLYNGGLGISHISTFVDIVFPQETNYTFEITVLNYTQVDKEFCWQSNDSGITNTSAVVAGQNFSGLSSAEGTNTWTLYCNNSAGDQVSDNVVFGVDTIDPIVNVTSPRGPINFHAIHTNLSLIWSVADTSLQACWYDYKGVNTTVNCGNNIVNVTITDPINKNLTFYANDTVGRETGNFTSWTYKVFENNQTFNNETQEGALEDFFANITLGGGSSISSVSLIYNETQNIGESFVSGQDMILRKTNLLIPNIDSTTSVNLTWQITLSDSTVLNLTTKTQTITNISLNNCTGGGVPLFNLTIKDEESQAILTVNTTIELAINVRSEDQSISIFNFSESFNVTNPAQVCLNKNISDGVRYSLSLIARYTADDRVNEYYNIVNSTLNNETVFQDIFLFDLLSADSTDFRLTFRGSEFVPVEGALVNLKRQYIEENTFKTVELPLTDSKGQTILHLVRNDIIYTIEIVKNGILLSTFSNIIAFCEDFTIGDCKIDLDAFSAGDEIFDYENDLGLIFTNPAYNNDTRVISFNFLTNDGTTKEVNLSVTRNDIFGNNSVCNNSVTSSGGTLSCTVPSHIQDSNLIITVFVDGKRKITDSIILPSLNYGTMGYLIFFVFMLAFILMFSNSKTGLIIGIFLGFISGISLGLIRGRIIGLGASGIWLLIIMIIMIWKLNKERQN